MTPPGDTEPSRSALALFSCSAIVMATMELQDLHRPVSTGLCLYAPCPEVAGTKGALGTCKWPPLFAISSQQDCWEMQGNGLFPSHSLNGAEKPISFTNHYWRGGWEDWVLPWQHPPWKLRDLTSQGLKLRLRADPNCLHSPKGGRISITPHCTPTASHCCRAHGEEHQAISLLPRSTANPRGSASLCGDLGLLGDGGTQSGAQGPA